MSSIAEPAVEPKFQEYHENSHCRRKVEPVGDNLGDEPLSSRRAKNFTSNGNDNGSIKSKSAPPCCECKEKCNSNENAGKLAQCQLAVGDARKIGLRKVTIVLRLRRCYQMFERTSCQPNTVF